MEFSSSSSDDEQLDRQLLRRLRAQEQEEQGIEAAAPSPDTTFTLPDGHTVTVRKGSVYIQVRDVYVHLLHAKARPHYYFGDGRLRIRDRESVSPAAVLLYAVGDGNVSSWPVVSLDKAQDNRFYIFKEVLHGQPEKAPARPPPLLAAHGRAPGESSLHRIVDPRRWQAARTAPTRVAVAEVQELALSPDVACLPGERLAYSEHDGALWRYSGPTSSISAARYDDPSDALQVGQHFLVDAAPQPAVGLVLHGARDRQGLILVGATSLGYVLPPDADTSLDFSALACVTTPPPPQGQAQPTRCCCGASPSAASSSDLPWVATAAERAVYEAMLDEERGAWMRRRVHTFRVTAVTSLCAVGEACRPRAVLCGMRNGSMQLVPLQRAARGGGFDLTPRHGGAPVAALQGLPGSHYEYVSVGGNGETLLWDIRYLARGSAPTRVLRAGRYNGEVGITVAFGGAVAAMVTPPGVLSVVNCHPCYGAEVYRDDVQEMKPAELCFGRLGVNYELFTLGDAKAKRYVLQIPV